MKSQTKALLASVMVLALALSSIGGVTYSWFSDTVSNNINIQTAEIDISTRYVENGTTYASINEHGDITINGIGSNSFLIEITNNNDTVPLDISSRVIVPYYEVLYDNSGNYYIAGYTKYDDSTGLYTPTQDYFKSSVSSAIKNINFGRDSDILRHIGTSYDRGPYSITIDEENDLPQNHSYIRGNTFDYYGYTKFNIEKDEEGNITTIGYTEDRQQRLFQINCNLIRCYTYAYDIGNITLNPGETKEIPFQIVVKEGFNFQMPDMHIEITGTQLRSLTKTIENDSATVDVDGQRPLFFERQGLSVEIPKATLTGLNMVRIDVQENNEIMKIILTYYRNGVEITNDETVNGFIRIIFSHNNESSVTYSGSITAPASDRIYIFTTGTGGSS